MCCYICKYENNNLQYKNPNILDIYIFFVKNVVFIHKCPANAIQDDITANTVPIRLHYTRFRVFQWYTVEICIVIYC